MNVLNVKSVNKAVGQRIAIARKEAKLTRSYIANMLKICTTTYANIENGRQGCSIYKLIIISQITGYSVATLIGNQ